MIKCLQLVFALVIVCFRDDPALVDAVSTKAGSSRKQTITNRYQNIRKKQSPTDIKTSEKNTLVVNAASVKNDVYLWIYTIHTIKRHIVMI